MKQLRVRFRSFQDIQEMVDLASAQRFPIWVMDQRCRVNATSFMYLFSLDYAQPLTLEMECSGEEWAAFVPKLTKFAVTELA